MAAAPPGEKGPLFSRYQIFLIAVLAFIQFTVILDFMVMAPLGAILMPRLDISAAEFSHVVSGYAFAAGGFGLLAAGFADKFDRKKLLMFFYAGFILGTLFCGLAPNYHLLLMARVITGAFGGVIGSVSMAIITDSFPVEKRGRVMGFVQMAFAASQVLGIPIGLYLANLWGWHSPFRMIVVIGLLAGLLMWRYMRPVSDHLHMHHDTDPWQHLRSTLLKKRHTLAFCAMVVLSTGGFLMMPFSTAFLVGNVGITEAQLPTIFLVTGLCSMVVFPLVGKYSDTIGRVRTFTIGTVIAIAVTLYYSRLGITPMSVVLVVNAVMFLGIGSRIVSSAALMTEVPELRDRGAFMSLSSSIQQVSGGVAASIAGFIVVKQESGPILHYDRLGNVCCISMVIGAVMIYMVDRQLRKRKAAPAPVPAH